MFSVSKSENISSFLICEKIMDHVSCQINSIETWNASLSSFQLRVKVKSYKSLNSLVIIDPAGPISAGGSSMGKAVEDVSPFLLLCHKVT